MTCKFTITIPAGRIDLVSPMDWFACHAAILDAMGIEDAGPVESEAQARAIAAKRGPQRTLTQGARP